VMWQQSACTWRLSVLLQGWNSGITHSVARQSCCGLCDPCTCSCCNAAYVNCWCRIATVTWPDAHLAGGSLV
jgi:hypothetical protein